MALDDISVGSHQQRMGKIHVTCSYTGAIPLFPVPHTSHFKIAFSSPEDPCNRLPQSVQNTSDPIAAIALVPTLFTAYVLLVATAELAVSQHRDGGRSGCVLRV